jgi:predicted nucleotidyltransferase
MKLVYDTSKLREFCLAHGIARLEFFGSALRKDFRPESDVDLLCTLRPGVRCTLLGWVDMRLKLEAIFGRPVDLVSRWGIERSQNPYRRTAVLSTAQPVYVEG